MTDADNKLLGKLDDISVVAALCVENKASS